jgi:F-box protein 11
MSSSRQFCKSCGVANRLQARFCTSCGSPMQLAEASSASLTVWGEDTSASTNKSTSTNIWPGAGNMNSTSTGCLVPQTLLGQRYRILKLLGQGGMGAVYLAEDLRFGSAPRAVKELSQQGLSPQEARDAAQAFKREADLLARLVHPNLPRIYDHFEERGRWYLTMDYIAGETLERRLGKLPHRTMVPEDVLKIALQLCDTLHYLHSQQPPIIFRDLKPANIMLTTDDHVYLIDFGIARLFKPGQATDTVALGSPGYAAPEQYGKAQTTASADIYSLGATLYQLLSGRDPSSDPFQFPALNLSSFPGGSELEKLVLQMVKIKREKRPASMLEVKQRLQTSLLLLQGQGVGTGQGQGTVAAQVTTPKVSALHSGSLTPPTAVPPKLPTQQNQLASNQVGRAMLVDQTAGQYRTLSEAIEELRRLPGSAQDPRPLILVRPGIYHERITLDLAVEIRGVGKPEEIVLENADESCLVIQTENASIHGLTFRSCVKQNMSDFHTVDIREGQASLEQCLFTGETHACIAISGSTTNPTLRHCKIYEGRRNGILVSKGARVTVEDCEIYANTSTQISIREDAHANIRRSKIYAGRDCGITASRNAQGTVEDCEIFENARHGVTLRSEGNLLLRRCVIRSNKDGGVASLEHGEGMLEQCEIFSNARLGIGVASWGKLNASDCKIHDNGSAGIHIYGHGQGVFKNCEIYQNATLGVAVKQDGQPHVLSCNIHHNRDAGIAMVDRGGGIFEDCEISANAKLGVGIASQADPVLRRCKIQQNEDTGLHIYQAGGGTIEDCDISSNQKLGIVVSGQSHPIIQRCEIHHNSHGGVHVHQDGRGTFVGCDIHTNHLSSFAVSTGGCPDVKACKLHSSLQNGLYVCNNGRGTFENCNIFSNMLSGVAIKTGASPIIRACQIYNNRQYGIHAHDNGQGTVEGCHIYGNARGSWYIHTGARIARL